MNCPVCNVPLIAVERDQVEVDYCISCRGLWFDAGEIEMLAEKLGVPLNVNMLEGAPAVTSEKGRACPRCGKKMLKSELPAARRVVTDRCSAGEGVWFDARELGVILDHATEAEGTAGTVVNFLGEMFGKRA